MTELADLAAIAFDKQEYVKMLEMMNTPIDYAERKKAFVALALARDAARQAADTLEKEILK